MDNEIAVQNLEKMAQQKGYGFLVKEKKEKKEYHVEFTVSETEPAETEEKNRMPRTGGKENKNSSFFLQTIWAKEPRSWVKF